jgi:hypothetical protein
MHGYVRTHHVVGYTDICRPLACVARDLAQGVERPMVVLNGPATCPRLASHLHDDHGHGGHDDQYHQGTHGPHLESGGAAAGADGTGTLTVIAPPSTNVLTAGW